MRHPSGRAGLDRMRRAASSVGVSALEPDVAAGEAVDRTDVKPRYNSESCCPSEQPRFCSR
jgi:hypothetical protein